VLEINGPVEVNLYLSTRKYNHCEAEDLETEDLETEDLETEDLELKT
jgi:hypothetical protein